MHIPDGFIAPQCYLPAYAVAAMVWSWAAKSVARRLEETVVPKLAAITALAYALGLIMLPLPGGTSGHVLGVAMLALLFGVRLAFLSYSLVLLLQSLLFGAGGITALPLNALAMGLAGSLVAVGVFRALRAVNETFAVVLAAWCSVMLSALLVATVLGIQPLIAQSNDGSPLFFPFGLVIVLPAVLIPHALIGVGEALLTLFVWRFARVRKWCP